MKTTQLSLSIGECLPISAKGLNHKVIPYTPYPPVRNINGDLIPLTENPAMKFRSIISGTDRVSIPLEGVYIGVPVRIGSIMVFSQYIENIQPGQTVLLSRFPVEGSIKFYGCNNRESLPFSINEKRLCYTGEAPYQKTYLTYRPYFETRLVDFELEADEWGVSTTWRITCDEI